VTTVYKLAIYIFLLNTATIQVFVLVTYILDWLSRAMTSENLTGASARHFETKASENATSLVVNGSCLCGAVKYAVTGDPVTKVLCHCNSRKKSSRSSFQANNFYNKTVS
jgi:hypothetical protein